MYLLQRYKSLAYAPLFAIKYQRNMQFIFTRQVPKGMQKYAAFSPSANKPYNRNWWPIFRPTTCRCNWQFCQIAYSFTNRIADLHSTISLIARGTCWKLILSYLNLHGFSQVLRISSQLVNNNFAVNVFGRKINSVLIYNHPHHLKLAFFKPSTCCATVDQPMQILIPSKTWETWLT